MRSQEKYCEDGEERYNTMCSVSRAVFEVMGAEWMEGQAGGIEIFSGLGQLGGSVAGGEK